MPVTNIGDFKQILKVKSRLELSKLYSLRTSFSFYSAKIGLPPESTTILFLVFSSMKYLTKL